MATRERVPREDAKTLDDSNDSAPNGSKASVAKSNGVEAQRGRDSQARLRNISGSPWWTRKCDRGLAKGRGLSFRRCVQGRCAQG